MSSVLTRTVARLLLLPGLLVALGVLVKGYADPGDGFTAGVIAALAVLIQYAAFGHRAVEAALPVRGAPALAWVGLGLSLVVALVPVALGEPILTHFPRPGGEVVTVGTLEIITAVAFDVGVFCLVVGASLGIVGALVRAADEERDA